MTELEAQNKPIQPSLTAQTSFNTTTTNLTEPHNFENTLLTPTQEIISHSKDHTGQILHTKTSPRDLTQTSRKNQLTAFTSLTKGSLRLKKNQSIGNTQTETRPHSAPLNNPPSPKKKVEAFVREQSPKMSHEEANMQKK